MSINKEDVLELLEAKGFEHYKTNINKYYFKKDDQKIKIVFNKTCVTIFYGDTVQKFTGIKNFKQCISDMICKEMQKQRKKQKYDFNKIHDINMILFHESGNNLYYLTRDLKILKKVYHITEDKCSLRLIDSEMTDKEYDMFKYNDLEDIWFRKVGYFEQQREKRLLGS